VHRAVKTNEIILFKHVVVLKERKLKLQLILKFITGELCSSLYSYLVFIVHNILKFIFDRHLGKAFILSNRKFSMSFCGGSRVSLIANRFLNRSVWK